MEDTAGCVVERSWFWQDTQGNKAKKGWACWLGFFYPLFHWIIYHYKAKLYKNHISQKRADPVRDSRALKSTNEALFNTTEEKVSNGVDVRQLGSYNLLVFFDID